MDVNLIQKFTINFRCNTSEDRRSCTDGGNIEGNNVVVRYEEVQNALEQEDNHENFMAIFQKLGLSFERIGRQITKNSRSKLKNSGFSQFRGCVAVKIVHKNGIS